MLSAPWSQNTGRAHEYDDTTVNESVANCTLLVLYICVIIGVLKQWGKRRRWLRLHKTSGWFNEYDRRITICICSALIARCIYFSDSITSLISSTHWIAPILYSGLSIFSYTCTSLSVLLLCRMWLSYADRARDSSLNCRLKQTLLGLKIAQVPLVCGLFVLVVHELVVGVLWTLAAASLLCAVVVVCSGLALTNSLTKYENGRFLARVSMTVKMTAASCCIRVAFYLVRVYFGEHLDQFRKGDTIFGVSTNMCYSVALLIVIILTELLPLTLCSMNLRQVCGTALTSTPSPALKIGNLRTLLCQDERPDARPLFKSIQGVTPFQRSESLYESDSGISQYQ